MIYTTKQGDMWDSIAYNIYGTSKYTDRLMLANGKYLSYYTFPEGIILEVPIIEDDEDESLPPWIKELNSNE